MPADDLLWRRIIVCAGALIYWGGVLIQGRRIRKRIGRSPNLKPRDTRERVLWAGWMLVVVVWIVQPLVVSAKNKFLLLYPHYGLEPLNAFLCPETPESKLFMGGRDCFPWGFCIGLALTILGYAATLWCYVTMGNAWRIGINHKEKNQLVTAGPYRWIRHPIYAFQTVMLIGGVFLLPTVCSVAVVVLHLILVYIKARDEETYLLGLHGDAYQQLMNRTGRIFPKIF